MYGVTSKHYVKNYNSRLQKENLLIGSRYILYNNNNSVGDIFCPASTIATHRFHIEIGVLQCHTIHQLVKKAN